MKFIDYHDVAATYMHWATTTFDLAEAAHKLLSGKRYSDGTSTGARLVKDGKELEPADGMRSGIEFGAILEFMYKVRLKEEMEKGDFSVPLVTHTEIHGHLLASQCIVMQFAILEQYEFDLVQQRCEESIVKIDNEKYTLQEIEDIGVDQIKLNASKRFLGVYSRQPVRKRMEETARKYGLSIPKEVVGKFERLSDRRNEIAHSFDCGPPNMKEAVEYFVDCIDCAIDISEIFGDESSDGFTFPPACEYLNRTQ